MLKDTGGNMTLLSWTPVKDKYGNPLPGQTDPNTYTYGKRCSTCGVEFVATNRSSWVRVEKK